MDSPGENYKDFIQAARSGDVDTVKALLQTGIDVNYRGEWASAENNTPPALVLAAEVGHVSVVELLLANGADVDNKTELSALVPAARQGEVEVVKRLIAAGAKSECKYFRGTMHALPHCASVSEFTKSHLQVVDLLIENGYDIDSIDENGFTALMNAVARNHHDLFELLIEKGANVNARANLRDDADSVIDTAAYFGRTGMVKVLLANGAKIGHPTKGYTTLHKAVACNSIDIVRLLLDSGCIAEAHQTESFTALHAAASSGATRAIKILLEAGFKVDARGGKDRVTPLHWAAIHCKKASVEMLLNAGADINARDCHGQTALHHATYLINSPDYISYTNGKATYHQVSVLEILLVRGADPLISDNHGVSALQRAIETYDICDDYIERTLAESIRAAPRGDTEAVKLLIKHGASVQVRDNNGCTVLHRAAHEWNIEVIQILTSAGADTEARKLDGSTPLFEAMSLVTGADERVPCVRGRAFRRHSFYAIEILLGAGANLHARLNNQRTLLHHTVQNIRHNYDPDYECDRDAVLLLLNRGVDVGLKDIYGETAQQLATKLGLQDISTLIDEYSQGT